MLNRVCTMTGNFSPGGRPRLLALAEIDLGMFGAYGKCEPPQGMQPLSEVLVLPNRRLLKGTQPGARRFVGRLAPDFRKDRLAESACALSKDALRKLF